MTLRGQNLTLLIGIDIFILTSIGLLVIYSTTNAVAGHRYLILQSLWIVVALGMTMGIYLCSSLWLRRFAQWGMWAVFLCLLYLAVACISIHFLRVSESAFPLVQVRNGAVRWLGVGPITIQPAEFAKFFLLFLLCSYYGSLNISQIQSFQDGFLLPLLAALLVPGLVFLGRSLSNSLLLGVIIGMVMFLAGVKWRFLALGGLCLALLGLSAVMLTPYRRQRIINFLFRKQAVRSVKVVRSGEASAKRPHVDNTQVERAAAAMGSGGLFGVGYNNGRLKHKSVPEARTDFIFAVIGEEHGFAGIVIVMFLYFAFGFLCFRLGMRASDKQSMLICYAVGLFLPAQAFVNVAVVSGIFPTTGVTAPLISYGGSSYLSVQMLVALVLNVGRQVSRMEADEAYSQPVTLQNSRRTFPSESPVAAKQGGN